MEDSYLAYCVDEIVFAFGMGVRSRLEEVVLGKGARAEERRQKAQEDLLKQILGVEPQSDVGKFKDPAAIFAKR